MGRPPGAPGSARRKRSPTDWELQQQQAAYFERFRELSEEDDDGQGVALDPIGYASRDSHTRGFVGDGLHFNGYDLGQDRQRRRQVYDYGEEYNSEEEYRRYRERALHAVAREREEALVSAAVEKIAKARTKGKTNVSLTPEEMEALERRRGQPPEPTPLVIPLASPPATPVKTPKSKVGSRTNSSSSLVTQKTRKKGSISLFGGPSSPSPAKSNSKAKVDRKPSTEQAIPYPPPGPPGIMVPGPNGVPIFAPMVNYAPLGSDPTRGLNSRSRSTSKHGRRDSTPPERTEAYAQYPPRYYPPSSSVRPPSSGSNRSLPADDIDWYPPAPRNRSVSNANYPSYRPDDYDLSPPLPAAQGRRNASGPPDVKYSSLRRVPPASSPLAGRPSTTQHAGYFDGATTPGRKSSALSNELERTSSSSSDDQGVQVHILPDGVSGGYSINRAAHVNPGQPDSRRRKGGRR